MSGTAAGPALRPGEFVPLAALLMSLVALAIDTMLPALPAIGREFGVLRRNDVQFVITALLVGLGLGQMLIGPLSDRVGRKAAMHAGLLLFMAGCLVSIFAPTFEVMIAGRVLQGIGVAGPRIVTLAMVRDQYQGRQMARLMSFVVAVFMLVPTVAPALGQGILRLGGWRSIFATFVAIAAIALGWFAFRQPETLPAARRRPFSPRAIGRAVLEVLRIRTAVGYMFAIACVFAPFIAYLSSAQQIFQEGYRTGALFPLWFGVLSLPVGCASLVNSRLVIKYGMRRLSKAAAVSVTLVSVVAWALAFAFQGASSLLALHGLPFRRLPRHWAPLRQSQCARDGASRPYRGGGGRRGRFALPLHLGAAGRGGGTKLRRHHVRPDRRLCYLRGWDHCRHVVGRGRGEQGERLSQNLLQHYRIAMGSLVRGTRHAGRLR